VSDGDLVRPLIANLHQEITPMTAYVDFRFTTWKVIAQRRFTEQNGVQNRKE
jgi:hypothetical protein